MGMIKEAVVLGSGGGRIVTINQERRTGGLLLVLNNGILVIDPGPGSINYFKQLGFNPFAINGVLVSHRHPDHYADCEVYIEALTKGGFVKYGLLVGSKSVLEEVDRMGHPSVSAYHKKLPMIVSALIPGDNIEYNGLIIKALKLVHSDPYSIGFKIYDGVSTISYFSDTELNKDIMEGAKFSDLLILSVLRPNDERIPGHLCSSDAEEIIKLVSPKKVLLTHFGMKMIRAPPENEAQKITDNTGIQTIAAFDGLKIPIIFDK
jgi:phosphoribosyl 1,2-cyclic phosphodiesterase